MSTNLPCLDAAQRLLTWIGDSPTPFHTVLTAQKALDEAGFTPLNFSDRWQLDYGKRYYVPVHDSTLIAFTVGSAMADSGNLRLALAHTDYPCFRVKPSPELYGGGCGKLNVEGYGGMLRYSWLDRPLSIAGKVALKGKDPFHPRRVFVDFGRPVATIPSLAIHLNRSANDDLHLTLQKDMLPIVDVLEQALGGEAFFRKALAEECGAAPEDILDYELYVYQCEQGCLVGLEETMLSSPRLDNHTSAEACIYGLTHARRERGVNLAVLFDHEEVGSRTRQGAAGSVLPNVIEGSYAAFGLSRAAYLRDMTAGFALCLAVAHCSHPNYPEKADPTNRVRMNGGITIKQAARQSYIGSCESSAVVQALCAQTGIPCQTFVNNADIRGGATLGAIAATYLPMQVQDAGAAIAAMHSARELMGMEDQYHLERLVTALFQG